MSNPTAAVALTIAQRRVLAAVPTDRAVPLAVIRDRAGQPHSTAALRSVRTVISDLTELGLVERDGTTYTRHHTQENPA